MIPRWALASLQKTLTSQRIASVVGPRQCGKTTLVENAHIARSVFYSLDIQANLQAAKQDPSFLIEQHRGRCLIIDEIQKAPTLIGEIKYAVDHNSEPGQFVLTGSSDYRSLPHANESLAGRVDFVRLRTFSTAERRQAQPNFLQRLLLQDLHFDIDSSTCGKQVALMETIRGGFPRQIFDVDEESRARWYASYLEQQILLDMKEQWTIRKEDVMRSLFPYLAAYSSKPLNVQGMSTQLGTSWRTLASYINVLKAMFLVDEVPAWTFKDYDAPGKAPKLFLTDTGLMSHIQRIHNEDQLLSDPSERASDQVGKLIETWVYNQLMPEIDLHPLWSLHHFRSKSHEIDFLLTDEHGALLGLEVKASQSINQDDFRHLKWFGEQRLDHPFTGAVLYAGDSILSFGNNCYAVPFAAFWGSSN